MDSEVRVNETGQSDLARLIAELRQWHIFRVAAAYGVGSWLLVQIVATIGPAFDLPVWVLRAVVLAAIVGFLATMAFLLFRPRTTEKGRLPRYLSGKARLTAAIAVLIIAALAGAFAIRSFSGREQLSVAVLPFADLSPARDKAYFAEGVAEEIQSTLAAEKGFKVLGRTSARQIERNPDPAQVRRSLGVTHLLEGSARTAGNALRVNVRLINTADGSSVWEEEYSGQLSEVFHVQDEIAQAVVRRMRGTFFNQAVRAAEATDTHAYENYLAARSLMRTRSEESLRKALDLAKKVIAADPNYAPGHAIYAELLYLLSDDSTAYGHIPLDRARALAIPHARKAVQLAPNKAEGYAALGVALPREQTIAPLKRAIELDPGRTELRVWLGVSLTALARHDEAYEQIVAAAEAEPLWPVAINRLTQVLATSGRTNEALDAAKRYRLRGGSEAQYHRFLATIARSRTELARAAMYDRMAWSEDKSIPYYVPEWAAKELALLGLHDQAIAIWPHAGPYGRLFMAGRWDALRSRAAADAGRLWDDQFYDYAIFALARARDWNSLAGAYRNRPARFADFCNEDPHDTPIMVIALSNAGETREAQKLLNCANRRLSREMGLKWSSPNAEPGRLEFRKASLLGAVGDTKGLEWLEKAVGKGWVGQYYSSNLADWPQFDAFRMDPRYSALQKRINARIASERAETLARR